MKGNANLVDLLNKNLADEFTAVHQYTTHAAIARNWGYDGLAHYFQSRADEEMEHSRELIDRILFLEYKPVVNILNEINVAYEVPTQLANDRAAELLAIKSYNEAIEFAVTVRDNSTRSLLEEILNDEIRHIDEIENYQQQIQQMTLQIFLSTQRNK